VLLSFPRLFQNLAHHRDPGFISYERLKPHFTGDIAMTALRQKMIRDMQLNCFAERTQKSYMQVVRQLAERYNKPPDQIT
jgi:hypothetical protein